MMGEVALAFNAFIEQNDALVSEKLLDLANPAAERIYAGKRGGKPSPKQADISIRLIELATHTSGLPREVVRHSGPANDPFGTLTQEAYIKGLQSDPQLPFFVQWQSPTGMHPSAGATGRLHLDCLEIAGDPQRVSEWLGNGLEGPLEDVNVEWVAPHGTPGIVAAQFHTADGLVRI